MYNMVTPLVCTCKHMR